MNSFVKRYCALEHPQHGLFPDVTAGGKNGLISTIRGGGYSASLPACLLAGWRALRVELSRYEPLFSTVRPYRPESAQFAQRICATAWDPTT